LGKYTIRADLSCGKPLTSFPCNESFPLFRNDRPKSTTYGHRQRLHGIRRLGGPPTGLRRHRQQMLRRSGTCAERDQGITGLRTATTHLAGVLSPVRRPVPRTRRCPDPPVRRVRRSLLPPLPTRPHPTRDVTPCVPQRGNLYRLHRRPGVRNDPAECR